MGTAELKTSINQLLQGITDDSVLKAVYTLLSRVSVEADWYDELSDESKASIQRGIEDAENGRFVPQSDVQAKVDKLLGRA